MKKRSPEASTAEWRAWPHTVFIMKKTRSEEIKKKCYTPKDTIEKNQMSRPDFLLPDRRPFDGMHTARVVREETQDTTNGH